MIPGFDAGELARLLDRPIDAGLGPSERAAFGGRRVLVTGAGGSIGSALARELAAMQPASLVLFDQSELGLFEIEREIRERHPAVSVEPVLGDVARRAQVRRVCRATRPDVVYHAAAYKHVTMAERAPCAAAEVNVLGTVELVQAAAEVGARFVLISSDKAADPKGVMGATKRFAEQVTLSAATTAFRPIVVRFGNVLGSSGSLVQIMRARVRAGLPLPITDPDATRYFMTASEAVSLVLRADLIGQSAEIYWLDMGRPVRVGDLVERFLAMEQAAGFSRVPIEIIGLRPGEKRFEDLYDRRLRFQRTGDRRIWVAREAAGQQIGLDSAVRALRRAAARADDAAALAAITAAVDGFDASELARARAVRPVPAAPRRRPIKRRTKAA